MREGAEVVLFPYGILVAPHATAISLAVGGAGGLAAACLLSWLLFRGLVAIPLNLFSVTNGLIALLAAGLAGQAAAVLNGANLGRAFVGHQLWAGRR
jgi:high-affinity iron transporter